MRLSWLINWICQARERNSKSESRCMRVLMRVIMRVIMLIVMIMHLDIGKSTSHKSLTEPIPKLLVLFVSFFLAY